MGLSVQGPHDFLGSQVVRQLEQEWKCHEMPIAQPQLCPFPGLPTWTCSSRALDEGLGCWALLQTCGLYLETLGHSPGVGNLEGVGGYR